MHTSRDLRTTFEHLDGREAWKHLASLPAGARVLEIGIGGGTALKELKEQFPHLKIVGTNTHIKQRTLTQSKADLAPKPPAKLKGHVALARGENLPFASNSFDFIYSTFSMSYIHDTGRVQLVREVHRLLKPGAQARLQTSLFSAKEDALYKNHPEIEVKKTIALPVLLKITKRSPKLEL